MKDYVHYFVCRDNLITEEELQKIIELCDKSNLQESKIVEHGKVLGSNDYRKSKNSFIVKDESNVWLFDKLKEIAEAVNDNTFNYDISYGFDYLQYAVYEDGDHFDFHMDMMLAKSSVMDRPRKLSFSLVLSENEDYEGGEFQFYGGGSQPTTIKQAKGRFIVFPSWLMHRVKPVTKGTRKSLVFWMQGPKFK